MNTVQMLTQIRKGQKARVFNKPASWGNSDQVIRQEDDSVTWVNPRHENQRGSYLSLTAAVMRDFEWELVPIEVDWATALEAVECGAKEMISLASNTTFSRHYILTGEARFSVAETRGKWILG